MCSFSFGLRISISSCSYFLQAVHTGTNLSIKKKKKNYWGSEATRTVLCDIALEAGPNGAAHMHVSMRRAQQLLDRGARAAGQ